MSSGFENDPHSQNGQPCPLNFFGITKYAELVELEIFYVAKRAAQLEAGEVLGQFDLDHLRKIHRYIFQDVFPWAGELRQVVMSKVGGAPFAYPAYIVPALTDLLNELKSENYLRSLNAKSFSQRAGYFLGEINAVHPFLEGNGRTQREFIRQLAQHAGHALSWEGISQAENTVASIASHTRKDHRGLATIIQEAIARVEESGKD